MVCMEISKKKMCVSEKFGLFYLPGMANEGCSMKK